MNHQTRVNLHLVSNSPPSVRRAANEVYMQAGGVFALSLTYATVRYHLFKGVAWADWPTYTVNKAFAVSALALMVAGIAPMLRHHARISGKRISGPHLRLAGGAIILHAILSLLLLDPAYYPKFFVGDKLTLSTGFALLLGVLAATIFVTIGPQSAQWSVPKKMGWTGVIAFIGGCHAALPGWTTWLQPLQWPALMPPLTLIAFLLGTAALLLSVAGACAIAAMQRKA